MESRQSAHSKGIFPQPVKYLLAKYVQDRDYVLETYKRIDEISERPPVKGIVYAIFEKQKFGFSPEDKDLLSDLEYYFG